MSQKSFFVAYLLWIVGGWFGLHHIYLGRDRHAFLMIISVGGYFGFGWFRDLWCLPEYVRDANADVSTANSDAYLIKLTEQMRKHATPPTSFVRHAASIVIADIFGYLIVAAIPVELIPDADLVIPIICAILVPIGVALGVHTVGNVGRHTGSMKYPLIGAYLTSPLYFLSTNSVFWTSLASTWCFNKYAKQWRRRAGLKRNLTKRLMIVTSCCCLYLLLWSSWLYFNCSVSDKSGEEIKCREAAKNFFKSPAWIEFRRVLDDLVVYYKVHGFTGIWREIIEAFDPQGETNALKVLNLTADASQEDITSTYRKLSRTWHPDRHKIESDKMEAQNRFIEIQQAYEVLSRIKSQRISQNKKERGSQEFSTPSAESL